MSSIATASPQVATALRHGVIAAQARDFDRARPLLQQVTEQVPDDVIAWYWLAIASPSAEAAIPCLRRVLEIDKAHSLAQEALSRLLIAEARVAAQSGAREQARNLAAEATGLTPENASTWRALAELSTSQEGRIDALRRVVQLTPEDAGIRTQFRQALLARGVMIARSDRIEARARFQEVAALNPADLRIWQALANLADTRDERAKYLRELLRIAPDHQQARATLRKLLVDAARDLLAVHRLEESRVKWREAIYVAGSDVELWLGFAEACDDPTEATRAIHAAQELDSHDPRVLEALAKLNGQQIDPGELPDPGDAFARFDTATENVVNVQAELVDDAMLDAIAQLPDATPAAPVAVAEATAPAAEGATEDAVANDATHEGAPDPAQEGIDLEAEIAAACEVTQAPPAAPVAQPAADAGPATVMVVDDSPTIRKILGLTLEKAGYNVVSASDGGSALEQLQGIVPNVVLLDISMPDLDGYEVCKRIKQDPRTSAVPVIMLSGKGAFFDKVKGHMAGATEYLTKPFETPAVLAVVTSHCQHHGQPAAEVHHG